MQITSHQKNIGLYIAKCVTGFVLITFAGQQFDIVDVTWAVISLLLVLSPDSKEAIPLTIVRIKCNLLASFASVLFLFLVPDVTVAICLAIVATILLCDLFKLMAGSRPALACVVIVSLHPVGGHLWDVALDRVAAVIVGCLVGLCMTFLFHRELHFRHKLLGGGQFNE